MGLNEMANLIIEVPDDLARRLERIAASQHRSIQQLALDRLCSLVAETSGNRSGSAASVLLAMQEPPHLSVSDVEELDAAIATGRLPVRSESSFRTDPA